MSTAQKNTASSFWALLTFDFSTASAQTVTFANAPAGALPKEFVAAVTGSGDAAPRWDGTGAQTIAVNRSQRN